MAQGIISGTTANSVIAARICWESAADSTACASILTAKLQLRRTNLYNGTPTGGVGSFTLLLGDQKRAVSGISLTVPNDGSWVTALEATAQIPHAADGTKTLTLSATGSLPPSSVTWVTCEAEITLDTIVRGSAVVSLESENGCLDGTLLGKLQPVAQGVSHQWQLLLGEALLAEGTLVTQEWAWEFTLGAEALDACYRSAPKADKVALELALSTYADEACTQFLGQTRQAFSLDIPQNEQTLPSLEYSCRPVGLEGLFSEDAAIRIRYIQNKTGLEVIPSATGKLGAQIFKQQVFLNGEALEEVGGVFSQALLTEAGQTLLTVTATDSRGFSVTHQEELTVSPYLSPQLLSAQCQRCDTTGAPSEEGEQLLICVRANHSFFFGHNGDDNVCALSLRWKLLRQEDYSEELPLFDSRDQDSDEVLLEGMGQVQVSKAYSYQIRLILRDQLGGEASTVFLIPTAKVHCHEGQGFLALGQYSRGAGLDIAEDWPIRIGGIDLKDYIKNIIQEVIQ